MKKRFATIALATLILVGGLVWFWPRSGTSPPALPGRDRSVGGSAGGDPAGILAGVDSPGAGMNQRFRATQKPEPRTYPMPQPPVAVAVDGKPGFVFSPFNDKVIDVRDIPPGTLVADPAFPMSEKRFFRVPDE